MKGVHDDVYVPGALAASTKNATYKMGQLVLVASDVSLIVGARYGRVTEIQKDDATPHYKVIFRFGDSTMDATVDAPSLLPLEDKLAFGAPAAFKDGEKWTTAMFVGPGAEKGKSWVITWGSHLEQHADVKPLAVAKGYKKGDKVWAARYSDLEPATIVESVDDGLRFKVKTADGKEDTVDVTSVTSPL